MLGNPVSGIPDSRKLRGIEGMKRGLVRTVRVYTSEEKRCALHVSFETDGL